MVTAAESVMPIGAFTAGRSSTAPLSLARRCLAHRYIRNG